MTWQAALRDPKAWFVPPINAGITTPALHVWPAHTLTCYRMTRRTWDDASSATVTGHADPIRAWAVCPSRASVTQEALNTVLAFTLARKRVAKLVQRSIHITSTRVTAVWIGAVEKLKAVVTAVTGETWKQNRRKVFLKECHGSGQIYSLDYSKPMFTKKLLNVMLC